MLGVQNISRRTFLKSAGVTGALVLGANVAPGSMISAARGQTNGSSIQPNLFVEISDDGTVTITCSRSEMGQGVRTGIPMILADELEADWQRVKIWQAPGDETKYDPAGKDGQNTDGSRSTRHHFEIMRPIGCGRPLCAGSTRRPRSGASIPARCMRRTTASTTPARASGSISARWWTQRPTSSVPTGDAAPQAQGQVAVEVHRPRHAGGRQLRLQHRRRHLRRRH